MLKGKQRLTLLAATGLIASVMVGGLVVGSNMGVKGRFVLTGGVDQWFSPPYITPYGDADGLLKALTPTLGGTLTRFTYTTPPGTQFWTGSSGNGNPPNWVLKPGEGLQIRPTAATEDVTIVGSHDPFADVPAGQDGVPLGEFPLGGSVPPGFRANLDALISVPWHTTYVTAQDFLDDLPSAGTITRLDQPVGFPPSFEFWTGTSGNATPTPNFGIDLGRGYLVRVLNSSAGYNPAHY